MKQQELLSRSFANALGTFTYTAAIAWLLFNSGQFFGKAQDFLAPLFLLLLLVISASVTGLLVLGKPAALYLNGQKKEGVTLFFATLGWLAVFAVIVIAALAIR